jgi:hypothetical protein
MGNKKADLIVRQTANNSTTKIRSSFSIIDIHKIVNTYFLTYGNPNCNIHLIISLEKLKNITITDLNPKHSIEKTKLWSLN